MDAGLTLEKLKIADRLSVLETHVADKLDTINDTLKAIKVEVHAIDENYNMQSLNLAERFGQLPCCVHKNELKWIKGGLYTVYVFVSGLVVMAIKTWVGK